MKSVLFLSFVLLLVSFVLTWIIKKISHRVSIFDIPNKRSSHSDPTPTGGGLAIVITWYIGITLLYFENEIEPKLYFALLSGIFLAIISLVDDFVNLKPLVRLVFQLITSIIAFVILGDIESIKISGVDINIHIHVITYPVAIIGMVWFINLFNFLDGIDGYASTEAISVALILLVFTGNPVLLLLTASTLGFVVWNWPKARIFMGDVGSTQLGFILIVLGIYFNNTAQFSIISWMILLSPFWFDATLTLFRRWRNGEIISQPHKKHVYQRFTQAGFSHLQTDINLLIINAVAMFVVLLTRRFGFLVFPLFPLYLLFLYILTRLVDKKVPFK